MGRIEARFEALRARGEKALVPFVMAGDPDLETTFALALALQEAGADLLELGFPHSDPIGDGPSIQRASERALAAGTSLRKVLQLVKRLRPRLEIPILLMGYANVALAMGEEGFVDACAEVGVDGAIVVDLPPEEGEALLAHAERRGVAGVLLAAPTTTDLRLALLARRTRGFLYYVSLTGVTGTRASLVSGLAQRVAHVRQIAKIPVCVGFGVASPAHAAEIGAFADGVVVGSALVDRIARAPSREAAVDAAAEFVSELKAPLRPRSAA